MDRAEYLRLRAELEERHRQDIAALDRIYERAGSGGNEDRKPEPVSRVERGRVDSVVRLAIHRMGGQEFGVREIQGLLSDEGNPYAPLISRSSISSALLRLVDEGMIDVVERGLGRRQSTYRRREPELDITPDGDDGMERV